MTELEIYKSILDSIPYNIEFCDTDHVIRFLNAAAKKQYGGDTLIGKSIFDCHNAASVEKIKAGLEHFRAGGGELFIGLNKHGSERLYMNPVRSEQGELIGYFERHELNEKR